MDLVLSNILNIFVKSKIASLMANLTILYDEIIQQCIKTRMSENIAEKNESDFYLSLPIHHG